MKRGHESSSDGRLSAIARGQRGERRPETFSLPRIHSLLRVDSEWPFYRETEDAEQEQARAGISRKPYSRTVCENCVRILNSDSDERRFVSGLKKAIFVVSHSLSGGAGQIWANLAMGFRAHGFEVQLMALYPFKYAQETDFGMPWVYIVKQRPTTLPSQIALLRSLVQFFRSAAPYAAFTACPAANVLVPLGARLAGASTKIVISHHSPANTHNRILNVLDCFSGSFKNVINVVCVSDAVNQSLHHRPKPYREKRLTIRNALPLDIEAYIEMLAEKRVRTRAENRLVVAVGRLSPQKNYPVLLRALIHIPDITLRIVGDGPDDYRLRCLAQQLAVDDRVEFLGHRTRQETLTFLSEGAVFAQPSIFEGHSLALIEAAKLGIPLVVSNVATQLEGITASDGTLCGIAVGPYDDAALANAILSLMNSSANYKLFSKKAKHLAASATFGKMVEKYLSLVLEV